MANLPAPVASTTRKLACLTVPPHVADRNLVTRLV